LASGRVAKLADAIVVFLNTLILLLNKHPDISRKVLVKG
jgi:hypothetical protein